jgi:hypothetical protein
MNQFFFNRHVTAAVFPKFGCGFGSSLEERGLVFSV